MKGITSRKFHIFKGLATCAILACVFSLSGCATVPKASVDLSNALGSDIDALHSSYTLLIKRYYSRLRTDVTASFNQTFVPAYINSFVKKGKLMQNASNGRADLVEAWARIAVSRIDKERTHYLSPIEKSEKNLLASVDAAFAQASRANAAITAQLSSIRSVNKTQEDVLKTFKLEGTREKINAALAKASREANTLTAKIDEAANKLKR